MKTTTLLCVLFALASNAAIAQLHPKKEQSFYTWALETEHYLDSIRTVINNDSLFYEEGGAYAEFKRYFNIHKREGNVTGDVLLHSQQLHNYYHAHALTAFIINPTKHN